MRHKLLLVLVGLGALGCAAEADTDAVTRAEAEGVQKFHDDWDMCGDYGWYGDGICDDFCLYPDPDCETGGYECTVGDNTTCPEGSACEPGYCYFYCAEGDPSCCEPARCVPVPYEPDPTYEPCGGKACGDPCRICAADDPNCAETAVEKFCDAEGACTPGLPMCEPTTCGGVICTLACPFGFERDENGCEICACAEEPSCQPVTCEIACEYGLQTDENGCGICACAEPPEACWGAWLDENGTCRAPNDGVYPDSCCELDCRSLGCDEGQWCSYCWGSFQCIPDGALC